MTSIRTRYVLPLCLVIASVGACVLAPAASAVLTCSYVESEPAGPRGNFLKIEARKFEEVVALFAQGDGTIAVVDDRISKRHNCGGPDPTVTNIDQIRFTANKPAQASTLFLASAPRFVPGATPETDLTPEIEVRMSGYGLALGIGGTPGPDLIQVGTINGSTGVDYTPGPSDPDAVISGRYSSVQMRTGGGPDTVTSDGGTGFDGPLKYSPISVYAGSGNDTLWGGPYPLGDIFYGLQGDDVIHGKGGRDSIGGGKGEDQIFGEGGRDEIDAVDSEHDVIDCGLEFDNLIYDRLDTFSHCEYKVRE